VLSPFLLAGALPAQRVTFSFLGGTNLTRDFAAVSTVYQDDLYPQGLTTFRLRSGNRGLLAGATCAIELSDAFAFELNALHRNLYLQLEFLLPAGERLDAGRNSIGTWEWPMLLRYRLPGIAARPFVEAGPSFRTRKNQPPSEPSQFGFAAGLGAEFRKGPLRLTPRIRYTRWAADGGARYLLTKSDQVEVLAGIGYVTSPSSWKVRGRRLRLGLVAGIPLTGALDAGPRLLPLTTEKQGYAAGLTLGWELTRTLTLEAQGLYRPARARFIFYPLGGGQFAGDNFTVLTWQFPVLAKWTPAPAARIRPVFETGPSFRLSGNRNGYHPSWGGWAAGVGAGISAGERRFGPVVRYTRWGREQGLWRFRPDQMELLFQLSF
jgi:hypothetical protein